MFFLFVDHTCFSMAGGQKGQKAHLCDSHRTAISYMGGTVGGCPNSTTYTIMFTLRSVSYDHTMITNSIINCR